MSGELIEKMFHQVPKLFYEASFYEKAGTKLRKKLQVQTKD